MATFVPNNAEQLLLTYMLKTASPPAFTIRLFKNDYTPVEGTLVAQLTEADFTGYSAITLTRGGWNDPSTDSGVAVMTYSAPQSWESSSTQTVYGFYMTANVTGNPLVYVQRFVTPRNLTSATTISVTPRIRLRNYE